MSENSSHVNVRFYQILIVKVQFFSLLLDYCLVLTLNIMLAQFKVSQLSCSLVLSIQVDMILGRDQTLGYYYHYYYYFYPSRLGLQARSSDAVRTPSSTEQAKLRTSLHSSKAVPRCRKRSGKDIVTCSAMFQLESYLSSTVVRIEEHKFKDHKHFSKIFFLILQTVFVVVYKCVEHLLLTV